MDLLQGSHAWGVFARQLVRIYPSSRLQDIQHLTWKERAGQVQSARKLYKKIMVQQSARIPSLKIHFMIDQSAIKSFFKEIIWIQHLQVVRAIVVRWAFILSNCLIIPIETLVVLIIPIEIIGGSNNTNRESETKYETWNFPSAQASTGSSCLCLQDDFSKLVSAQNIVSASFFINVFVRSSKLHNV